MFYIHGESMTPLVSRTLDAKSKQEITQFSRNMFPILTKEQLLFTLLPA